MSDRLESRVQERTTEDSDVREDKRLEKRPTAKTRDVEESIARVETH